jgi:hypothetical protein
MKNIWKYRFKHEDILNEKIKKMKPFLEKYGQPVVVHAVESSLNFQRIIKEGKLRLPNDHGVRKKSPLMEKFLGVDNSIFLSVGFDYWAHYNFRFNLIFDLGILTVSDYYKRPLPFKCYTAIANYWYKNDRDYLIKIKNVNKLTEEVIGKFILKKEQGNPRDYLQFWKIEEIFYDFILKYQNTKKLFRIAEKKKKEIHLKYPYSKRIAKEAWKTYHFPEIIHSKEIDLITNPYFLGFFIEGHVNKKIKFLLEKKYVGKIFYDGKKLRSLR